MAANSVTGSFRGIDVSFAYNGPHIVMSVLNNAEDGRRLRVMFQQQPLSGRVNWVSFQLTRNIQDVVVPAEVIQSHKLAFYVDNHEPISTNTEKILEELRQLQDQQLPDNHSASSTSDSVEQNTHDADAVHLEVPEMNGNNIANDLNIEAKILESRNSNLTANDPDTVATQSIQQAKEEPNGEEKTLEPLSHDAIHNDYGQSISHQEKVVDNSTPEGNPEAPPNISKPNSENHNPTSKRKTQYIGRYIPNVSTELQFKIKVPSFPKSSGKKQSTFIPPRTAFALKSNGKKNGFFGQLAGTFGFTFSNKKKEYYTQQHRHLYEKFYADLEKLESDYNNGCGISLDNWDLEVLNEEQTAVLILNLMVNEISTWKKVVQKRESTKDTLAKSLQNIEDELKYTLKQTRGINAPAPTLFPDRTAMNDQDLMNIQEDCDTYLKRFSQKLAALEQKHAEKVRIPVFKKFLIEFVRDKLFPNVAKFIDLPSVQSRLNWFLDLVDYEIIPIEPGKTKISPEHHDVKAKRSCDLDPNTVVEVVKPGLQTKNGKRVVQNAVVIQAE